MSRVGSGETKQETPSVLMAGGVMIARTTAWRRPGEDAYEAFAGQERQLKSQVFALFKPATLSLYHNEIDTILTPSWEYYISGMIHLLRTPVASSPLTPYDWIADYQQTLTLITTATLTPLIEQKTLSLMCQQAGMKTAQGSQMLFFDHPDVVCPHPERG